MNGESYVLAVFGVKGSGKSTLLAQQRRRFRKVLILDLVAEYLLPKNRIEGAHECTTLRASLDALERCASLDRWVIVAAVRPSAAAVLVSVLVNGYAKAVGGVAVECGEAEKLYRNHAGLPEFLEDAIHRGRHFAISMLLGTRRPRDLNRLVTSQADVICTFRQHEARDLEYVADNTSPGLAARIKKLGKWEYVEYRPPIGVARHVSKDGDVIAVLDPETGDARPVPAAATGKGSRGARTALASIG